MKEMSSIFKDKIIFITGAGSIGSEILKQLVQFDVHSIRMFDNDELKLHNIVQEYRTDRRVKYLFGDIRDKERLRIAMRNVDYVFHTAAMKHVSFCESNPIDAVKTNVIGTQNIIDVSIEENVEKVINISTDKAANPISVMGATKLLSEKMIVSASRYKGNIRTIFTTVRFGNVFGSSGSVVPVFERLIKNGDTLKITDPSMSRFMMSIDDAVKLIFKSTAMAHDGDIFILKMPSIKIIDLAKAMMDKYNNNVGLEIIGVQSGEKIHESLITREESNLAYENEDIIVIPCKKNINYYTKIGFKEMKRKNLKSDNNKFMTTHQILEMIK